MWQTASYQKQVAPARIRWYYLSNFSSKISPIHACIHTYIWKESSKPLIITGIAHLEPKCVNNVNHLNSLVINTLIFISTFSRRISTDVYFDGSLNNPLQTKTSKPYIKEQLQKILLKLWHLQVENSVTLTFPSTSHSIPFSISLYGNESERSSSPEIHKQAI